MSFCDGSLIMILEWYADGFYIFIWRVFLLGRLNTDVYMACVYMGGGRGGRGVYIFKEDALYNQVSPTFPFL